MRPARAALGVVVLVAMTACSSSATRSSPTSTAASVRPSPASGSSTTATEPTTTSTVAATTTSTVAAKPFAHGELWDIVDAPALLTRADGTTALARFRENGAFPITGTFKGVDVAPIGEAARIVGTARFDTYLDTISPERQLQLYLTASPAGAASLLAEVAPAFADDDATELTSAIPGARGFEWPYGEGRTQMLLSFGRGPVFGVLQLPTGNTGDTAARLAEAETVVRATIARLEARLASCGTPCVGVAGATPTWPRLGRDRRPVGTCANYTFATADLRPPATSTVDVPCSEVHDIEYVAAVQVPDLASRPNRLNLPLDLGVVASCEDAMIDQLVPGGRLARRSVIPIGGTADQIAAGDIDVVCQIDVAFSPGFGRIPPVPS